MAICGSDCCAKCPRQKACGGCEACQGRPFGGSCIAAECILAEGMESYLAFKETLVEEINALGIRGLEVDDLNLLFGSYVNLEYPLPNGQKVKLLKNERIYLGNQIERVWDGSYYGVVADRDCILVSVYGSNGKDPVLLLYKHR